jgi:hypothetical protein
MIIVVTAFTMSKPITREEARRIFLSTAPTYRGVPGLLRKHYVLSQDGITAGGVYLWTSRPEAEAMYTDAWRAFVREKYRTEPSVTYWESPVTVDNVAQQVVAEELEGA